MFECSFCSFYFEWSIFRGPSPRQLLPVLDRRVSDGRQRQPVNYNSISSNSYGSHDSETSAVVSRYKYYTKLAPHSDSSFVSCEFYCKIVQLKAL
jgi:hypothetical protein